MKCGIFVSFALVTLVAAEFEDVAELENTGVEYDDTLSKGENLGEANNSELATTSNVAATEHQMRKDVCMLILLRRFSFIRKLIEDPLEVDF